MKRLFAGLIIILALSATVQAADHYAIGVDYFRKANYNKAANNFEQSIKVNPKNVNARYYLAQTYLKQKRVSDATAQYNRIILLAPSSDAAKLSQKGLSLINESYNQRSTIGIASDDDLAKYKDNYLEYILSSEKLIRWHSFPIKVYVEQNKQQNTVLQAFSEWQKKTNNLVNFEYVASAQNAQIIVTFEDKLEDTSTKDAFIAGYSKPYYNEKNITKSEILLLKTNPSTGKAFGDNEIYATTLHELGHSLGFNGHSPIESDIMYSRLTDTKNLSKRDINTMCLLYKYNNTTFAKRAKSNTDVKLQEALNYTRINPGKSYGWGVLGDIYRDKKMYSEAIKNYNKAISIEPGKAELYNLIGTTYSLSGDNKNAFTSFKKACDLDKTNPFYIKQFCIFCAQTGQKAIGKEYLNNYLNANPQGNADDEIKKLKLIYQ